MHAIKRKKSNIILKMSISSPTGMSQLIGLMIWDSREKF